MKKHAKKIVVLLLAVAMLVPTVAMLVSNAADGDPVELAFNNIFIFEKWATNKNSTTVQTLVQAGTDDKGNPVYNTPVDSTGLTTDIQNGTFTLTKNDVDGIETYTCFGGTGANNFSYYMADVKPNTSYTFYYHVTGNIWSFTPYVFYYDAEGQYLNKMDYYTTPAYNENSFLFTTPEDAEYIQVRFTIGDTQANRPDGTYTSFYATVKDIAICQTEVIHPESLFNFNAWASNANSAAVNSSAYGGGTLKVDASNKSLTLTTDPTLNVPFPQYLFTNFSMDSTTDYYTISVTPGEKYTFSYNLECASPTKYIPHIVLYDTSGKLYTDPNTGLFYMNKAAASNGKNTYVFTVPENVYYIEIVFALYNTELTSGLTYTVKDIKLYKNSDIQYIESRFDPHRQVYTEGAGNYTNLPVPTDIPEGKIFAGWYTGEDGKGKLITSDTKISYESYSVYPKYETKLDEDGLKIDTPATKLTYTLGEKVNTAGLVLEATVTTDGGTNVYKINSGYSYSPETVATTPGTQTITVTYGGQSVSYDVTVVDSITESVKVNGVATDVAVTNDEYFINLTGTDFNRYEITYYSDAYVKAVLNTTATDGTTVSEEFFLEPSTNGSFASFIDGFLDSTIYTNISSISFEPLDKDFFTFKFYSVETILANKPTDNMQYQQDKTHKVGIDLSMGGAIAYIEELSGNVVASYYGDGQAAQIDYKNMISGGTQISEGVNLINRHDPGRFVQQSYYGTREDPYVIGDYNGVEWNYNPVQGGNYMFESSKIVDYRITSNEIYVKTRPLDWGKYSDEFANSKEGDWTDNDGDGQLDEGELVLDPRYGDEYITDSYMEAWYVFEDDMVKTYCRFVDYSGYPSNTTTQELPAFYPVEPLNTFAYYDGETVWEEESKFNFANAYKENEPDFWGVSPNYNAMLKANNKPIVNPQIENPENWAAFMGSDDENSFGIGIYSAGVTEFHYGTYPQIYKEPAKGSTAMTDFQFNNADMYEIDANGNNVLTMPDMQDATSYISPVGTMTFESYKPYNYSYYIASGTLHDIREDFRRAKSDDDEAAVAGADIAVPETSYMKPADGPSKIGQYYVNNILDTNNNYKIKTVAESTDAMSFGVHIDGATSFTVDITNATNSNDDIDLYKVSDNSEVSNTHKFALGEHTGSAAYDEEYYLAFNTTGLNYGEKATAKWVITGYDSSNKVVGTYTVYTVLYASERTIGAVAESSRADDQNNEVSSWITGANGVDHSQRAPLGSFHADLHDSGYFKYDPSVYDETVLSGIGSKGTSADYIFTDDPSIMHDNGANDSDDYGENAYVMQGAVDGADGTRTHSYLGLLKIDKSRYTNTNQIPNLKIGFDALRVADAQKNSLEKYYTYYTLGTNESFTSTKLSDRPSGWIQHSQYTNLAEKYTIPYRETVVPAYSVTDDIDGKYIHALNQGVSQGLSQYNYATAGSSLLISLTDKGELRDSVTEGYTLPKEDYSESSYNKFLEELEDAATILGDPSATQEQIDQAQKDLDDVKDELVNIYYSLKYDNLFSAYEYSQKPGGMVANDTNAVVSYSKDTAGITITNNNTSKTDISVSNGYGDNYYNITVTPSTEYVFEYDLETVGGSQMHLFFFDVAEGNTYGSADWLLPSGRSVEFTNSNGATTTTTIADGSNKFMWYYGDNSGHVVMKFKTPANADVVVFRFGNNKTTTSVSTFSNIRLIETSKYYADVDYAKTEDVYLEHASYGTLPTLTRAGYTFGGWIDVNGNAVTGADIATENKSIYSKWTLTDYTIKYDANGGSVSPASKVYDIEDTLVLPNPTNDGYTFAGWKVTTADGSWTLNNTYQAGAAPTNSYGNVTLTAKWVINDSALVTDTVVIDFAKPIDIKPLANDTVYASAEGTKTFLGFSSDGTNYGTSTINGTYGTFTVNGDTVTYTPTEIVNGTEKIYYHASVVADGATTNIKNEIIVVPASNVLYEEGEFTVLNSGVEWETITTSTAGTGKQDASGENDIYGYDSSYNQIANYSNSSALSVTVDSQKKRSQNIAFTFEGTGFDLNSACGYNTGVMIVSLRDNNYVNDKGETEPKVVKSYIVDTYYGDYNTEGASNYASTLYQVPIISDTGREHSNYTIQIVASYLPSMSGALNTNSVSTQTLDNGMTANIAEYANSEELREALADIGMEYVLDAEEVSVVWFDEDSVLNGGEGVNTVEDGMLETQSTVTSLLNVVDSVRVYNPITDGDQYYIPSEQGVVYYNVIDNLTTKDSWLSGEKLFAYIMGTDKQDITVENYSQIGPKDELYLTSGTGAITFTIKNLDKSKSKVMISLKAASGKDVVVGFGNENTRTITSNTEMYYDITDYVNDSDGTVVIENKTAGTLLSVGSVKLSGMVQPAMLSMFNLDTALAMMSAPKTEPDVTEPETTVPDVTEPETTVPDVTEPETTVPDVTEPETTVPDVTEPETTVPDVTEPETTVPDVTEPETTVPDVTEPEDTTDPDDSEETTDPDGSEEPADPDDSTECWLVRLIKWIISMFKKIFSAINSVLGF